MVNRFNYHHAVSGLFCVPQVALTHHVSLSGLYACRRICVKRESGFSGKVEHEYFVQCQQTDGDTTLLLN